MKPVRLPERCCRQTSVIRGIRAERSWGEGWKPLGLPKQQNQPPPSSERQPQQRDSDGPSSSTPHAPPASARAARPAGSGPEPAPALHFTLQEMMEPGFESQLLRRRIGPIELRPSPGKGRGLFALRTIEAGELLMVGRPTVQVAFPPPQTLVSQISTLLLDPAEVQLLDSLHDGTPQSPAALPDLQALFGQQQQQQEPSPPPPKTCLLATWIRRAAPPHVAALADAALRAADLRLSDTPAQEQHKLERGVAAITGSRAPDQPAALAAIRLVVAPFAPGSPKHLADNLARLQRQAGPNSFSTGEPLLPFLLGREPHQVFMLDGLLAMANHSCAPNAEPVLMEGVCLLKSTRRVERGEEVCVTYAQPAMDWPRAQRGALMRRWGFACACGRCVVEASLGGAAEAALRRAVHVVRRHGLFDGSAESMAQTMLPALLRMGRRGRAALLEELWPACEAVLDAADAADADAADADAAPQRLLILGGALKALYWCLACMLLAHRSGAGGDAFGAADVTRLAQVCVATYAQLMPASWGAVQAALVFRCWAASLQGEGGGGAEGGALLAEAEGAVRAALRRRYGDAGDAATEQRLFDVACVLVSFEEGVASACAQARADAAEGGGVRQGWRRS